MSIKNYAKSVHLVHTYNMRHKCTYLCTRTHLRMFTHAPVSTTENCLHACSRDEILSNTESESAVTQHRGMDGRRQRSPTQNNRSQELNPQKRNPDISHCWKPGMGCFRARRVTGGRSGSCEHPAWVW